MHPRQTISFLLLFVEFRNQTEQNNARSSRLGRGPLGCSVPQGRKDGFSAHARAKKATRNAQTQGRGQTIRRLGTLGQSRGGDAGTSSSGAMVARRPPTTRADDIQGTLFHPNTSGAACSFTTVPQPRAFLSVFAWLWPCVRDARGALGSEDRRSLEVGASEARVPELLLKAGGRTGSGLCFNFMTFSR